MRLLGYRGRLAVLVSTIIGINVGYTAVLPHLAVISGELRLNATSLGAFFSGFAVAKAVAQAPGGRAVDRLGGTAVTVIALLVAAAGIATVALSDSATVAITGRIVWGFADGLASPALYACASALAHEHGRDPASAYAKLGAAAVGAFALGPALVGALHGVLDWRGTLWIAAALTILNALVAAVIPASGAAREGQDDDAPSLPAGWLRAVLIFGAMDLCANVLWSAVEPLVPLSIADGGHGGTGRSALVLGVGMGVFVVATMALTRLAPAYRRPGWGALTMAVLGLAGVGLTWPANLTISLVAIAIFMIAQAQIYLVARDGLTEYSGGTGRAWGVFGLMSDIGFILGPLIGIALFDAVGDAAFSLLGQAMLAAAAVFAVIFQRIGRPAGRRESPRATTTTG